MRFKIIIATLLLLFFACKAEIITAIGTAEPRYKNLPKALESTKQNALTKYIVKNCKNCKNINRENFTVTLVLGKSITVTPLDIIMVAEYNITGNCDGGDR